MTLVLGWRAPDRAIVTRWSGPEGMAEALARDPALPIAAVVGPPGPPGPQGPQGPAGAPQRIDAATAATWILPHGLSRIPMVQVFIGDASSGGEDVIADVAATDTTVTITHASPQAGFVLVY